jgi:hypothetical protein
MQDAPNMELRKCQAWLLLAVKEQRGGDKMPKKTSYAKKDDAIDKKMSTAMRKKDDAMDKRMGIKEGSKRDVKMDTKMLKSEKKPTKKK